MLNLTSLDVRGSGGQRPPRIFGGAGGQRPTGSVTLPTVASKTSLTVCVDSKTWNHKDFSYDGREEDSSIPDGSVAGTSEGERDWYEMRTCTWVAEDPAERCNVKGKDPAGDTNRKQKASKACPVACGKCWERRLTSSQVTTLV